MWAFYYTTHRATKICCSAYLFSKEMYNTAVGLRSNSFSTAFRNASVKPSSYMTRNHEIKDNYLQKLDGVKMKLLTNLNNLRPNLKVTLTLKFLLAQLQEL